MIRCNSSFSRKLQVLDVKNNLDISRAYRPNASWTETHARFKDVLQRNTQRVDWFKYTATNQLLSWMEYYDLETNKFGELTGENQNTAKPMFW